MEIKFTSVARAARFSEAKPKIGRYTHTHTHTHTHTAQRFSEAKPKRRQLKPKPIAAQFSSVARAGRFSEAKRIHQRGDT
jgi:hypothetical protein